MSENPIRKTYLCPIIGTGTMSDPWRAKVADLNLECSWFKHKLDSTTCLVTVVALNADHAVIAQDPDFELISDQKNVVVPPMRFAELKTAYPNIEEKLGVSHRCSIQFKGVTGE